MPRWCRERNSAEAGMGTAQRGTRVAGGVPSDPDRVGPLPHKRYQRGRPQRRAVSHMPAPKGSRFLPCAVWWADQQLSAPKSTSVGGRGGMVAANRHCQYEGINWGAARRPAALLRSQYDLLAKWLFAETAVGVKPCSRTRGGASRKDARVPSESPASRWAECATTWRQLPPGGSAPKWPAPLTSSARGCLG